MSEPFLGQIMPVGFNFPPRGWAACEGQILPISQNTALFSLLGTTFGGDGRTTFVLPDLRGRSMIGRGNGPGLSPIAWGQRGGSETNTLTIANMPSHNHTAQLHAEDVNATFQGPLGKMLAKGGTNSIYANPDPVANKIMAAESIVVANNGGSQSFNTLDPFLGLQINIALQGIFPSRN